MEIDIFCPLPLISVRINPTGDISFCQHMGDVGSYVGNLEQGNFDDSWFSDQAEEVRLSTLAGNLASDCRCPTCPFTKMPSPFHKQHVFYNEYPTRLELVLPKEGLSRYLTFLDKFAHLIHNLSELFIEGEAFQDNVIFDILGLIKFSQALQRIWVHAFTNGEGFDLETQDRYISSVPYSVTTFQIQDANSNAAIRNIIAFADRIAAKRQFTRLMVEMTEANLENIVPLVRVAAKAKAKLVFGPRLFEVNSLNFGRFTRVYYDLLDECARWRVPFETFGALDIKQQATLI